MEFIFVANHPVLDLLNTRPVLEGETVELLVADEDVVRWAWAAGLGALPTEGFGPGELSAAARELREAVRDVLEGRRAGQWPPVDLTPLNVQLSRLGPPRLDWGEPGVTEGFSGDGSALGRALGPLLVRVSELLARADAARVRRCANPSCVLWFLDTTKSGARRWHSMESCGNAHKAREHRARARKAPKA